MSLISFQFSEMCSIRRCSYLFWFLFCVCVFFHRRQFYNNGDLEPASGCAFEERKMDKKAFEMVLDEIRRVICQLSKYVLSAAQYLKKDESKLESGASCSACTVQWKNACFELSYMENARLLNSQVLKSCNTPMYICKIM